MKHILSPFFIIACIMAACTPSAHHIAKKPVMQLHALQAPLVINLADNKVIAEIVGKKLDSMVGLESFGNHFILLAIDTAHNPIAYSLDTNFAEIQKFFSVQEQQVDYHHFANSIYAFPALKHYAINIFNTQDTAYLSGAISNGAGLREDNPVYFYIQPFNRKPLAVSANKYSFLYHYGLWKSKQRNSLDKTVFQYTDSLGKLQRMGNYTDPIVDKAFLTDRDIVCAIDGKQFIYYAFSLLDTLYKIDLQGQRIAGGRIPNVAFAPYPKDRQSDIAYERQYLSKSTLNKRILLLKDYVVLLGQLPKKSIVEKSSYSYTVYTKDLKPLYYDTIRYSTPPELFQVFGNRFCFFTPQLKQLVTYEVK